jgi:membrane protein YdbS with pleckstrin-like domain
MVKRFFHWRDYMTGLAFILILIAAFSHATWNYLAKKACGGTAFIWLFAALSTVLYFPLAMWNEWAKPVVVCVNRYGKLSI